MTVINAGQLTKKIKLQRPSTLQDSYGGPARTWLDVQGIEYTFHDYKASGIDQARRGWLEKADVLNTCTLEDLRPLLARTMH